jgi:predicted PhzF superfamily epimerase YddE/YHI9
LNACVNELDALAGPEVLDVLHVFCGGDGRHGNALGVVRDARRHPDRGSRQALAAELGFSETVFVDDPERGTVDIYTPTQRLLFAGHPLVGVAWLLDLQAVRPPAGEVWVRDDGEFTWITARAEWAPPRRLVRYASPAEVDALPVPSPAEGRLYAWAWQDEAAGRVRARAFGPRGDHAVEDEATGAAALLLTERLGRALNITQGRGSQILTAPGPDGIVEIGGRVRLAAPAPVSAPPAGPASGAPSAEGRRPAPTARMTLPRSERTRLPHAVIMPEVTR